MFKVKQPTMRETAYLYLRCFWAKHFGPKPERNLVLYPHEFRKRYVEPAVASLFEEQDPMVKTIPGRNGNWSSLSINGVPQKKDENGKWVSDKELYEKQLAHREEDSKKRRELYWGLRTRVLALEEMDEVRAYDYRLLIDSGTSFNSKEVKKEFNDALVRQFYMRLEAERNTAR